MEAEVTVARRLVKSIPVCAAVLLGLVAPRAACAQQHNVATDGSLGAKVALTGPNYAIAAALGKQVGGNLFHSFSDFGLDKGESAIFTGPAGINNVISRVTGGNLSSVNGKIDSSAIAGANFYLINPSGIVFGPSATVNVAGSFHAATADYLRLSDGAKFQATNPSGSTLTAAAPAAFGFLNAAPPTITVNGSQLTVSAGTTLGLVGGPGLTIGNDAASGNKAVLNAPAGTIHVASVASTGEVPVDPTNSAGFTVNKFGAVNISGGAKLDVSDPAGLGSGGSVFIRAGTLTIDASEINGDNYGSGSGGQLALYADGQITITGGSSIHAVAQSSGTGAPVALTTGTGGSVTIDNSSVAVGSLAAGDSGSLAVTTGSLTVQNGGSLASTSAAGGAGGPITITADSVLVDGGSALNTATGISSTNSGSGPGGAITIDAGQLSLHDGAGILAQSTGGGPGGSVTATIGDSATIDSGASLGTTAAGAGNAGQVVLTAGGAVAIDMTTGVDISVLDGVASKTTGDGRGGDVALNAASLAITNYGLAMTGAGGAGSGGNIAVTVTGDLTITSLGTAALNPTGIGTKTEKNSSGKAGDITVSAGTIRLSAGGGIGSPTNGSGNGGNVTVTAAGALSLDGAQTNLSFRTSIATATSPDSSGFPGNISITADTLSILNGAELFTGTITPRRGGNISIHASGAVTIDGSNAPPADPSAFPPNFTGIVLGSFGFGDAGNMSLSAGSLNLSNGGMIFSGTAGLGRGGDISLAVGGALSISGPSGRPTPFQTGIISGSLGAAPGNGNAGDVSITAGSVSILDQGLIFTGTGGAGNAGKVTINTAGALSIDGTLSPVNTIPTGIIAGAVPGSSGNGGDVAVNAGSLSINDGLIASVTTGGGNGGDVSVDVAGPVTLKGGDSAISFVLSTGQALTGISTDSVATNLPQDVVLRGIVGILTSALPGATGNAGDVSITAGSLDISHNAVIFSPSFGPGRGGDVSVNAAGALTITGTAQSGLVAETASLRATTGNAGNATINAGSLTISDNGAISSHALQSNGGNVDISVNGLLHLTQGTITTQVDASTGNGGNITIEAPRVVLDRSTITADAFGSGANGNIDIRTPAFVESAESLVRASGVVRFSNPPASLASSLVVLPSALRNPPQILRDSCAARSALPRSSLTDAGRGGLPQDPEATLPALYFAGRDAPAAAPAAAAQSPPRPALGQGSLRVGLNCGA